MLGETFFDFATVCSVQYLKHVKGTTIAREFLYAVFMEQISLAHSVGDIFRDP